MSRQGLVASALSLFATSPNTAHFRTCIRGKIVNTCLNREQIIRVNHDLPGFSGMAFIKGDPEEGLILNEVFE